RAKRRHIQIPFKEDRLSDEAPSPRLIVVMGVSASGKSSVGRALASRLGVPFLEGDDYHPRANVEKMRSGLPLQDEDRWPWLTELARALRETADRYGMAVAACSALKERYRSFLSSDAGEAILWIFLEGSRQ